MYYSHDSYCITRFDDNSRDWLKVPCDFAGYRLYRTGYRVKLFDLLQARVEEGSRPRLLKCSALNIFLSELTTLIVARQLIIARRSEINAVKSNNLQLKVTLYLSMAILSRILQEENMGVACIYRVFCQP